MKKQPRRVGFGIHSERTNRSSVEEDGLYYIYVRVYLQQRDEDEDAVSLDQIDYVIYKLHESFGDERLQRSGSRSTGFEIKIWTYGWFKLTATVITKDGAAFEVRGKVEFKAERHEIEANGAEEFCWD